MKIEVIGRGNVGSQFARIFGASPVPPRSLEGMSRDADLYIIAVSDSGVEEVVDKFPEVEGIVVHTTGSVPMEVLSRIKCSGYGVLYPFQTISKTRPLPPENIPLLIEADNSNTEKFLFDAAWSFGFMNIGSADSDKRRKVHLTGTFACNFTNAMIAASQKILSKCGINPDIVNPLIAETFEKIKVIPAKEAQTGPAVRKDFPTMEKHLKLLKEMGMDREIDIYKSVSDYIIGHNNE